MTQASQKIMQQYIDGGVIPAQLEGQAAVSKTYVDGQLAIRDTNISAAKNAANMAQSSVDNHKTSTTAHPAQNITYSGEAVGNNVKQALDGLDTRIDRIVSQSGSDNTEIVDARGGFPVLSARLDNVDKRLNGRAINVMYPPPPLVAAKGDGSTNDTASIQGAINTGKKVLIPFTPFGYIVDTLELGDNTEIEGSQMVTIYSVASTLFNVTAVGCSISNLKVNMNGAPAGATAVRFRTKTRVISNIRLNKIWFVNCYTAIQDESGTTNYLENTIVEDIKCILTKGVQIYIHRSRGFLTFREVAVDHTFNTTAVTFRGAVFEDFLGLELEKFDVIGPLSSAQTPVYQPTAIGIYIKGTPGEGASSVWMTRVLVDNLMGDGVYLENILNLIANNLEVYQCLGNPIVFKNITVGQLSNVFVIGGKGMTGAATSVNGVSFDTCQKVAISNLNSSSNTGTGVVINNSSSNTFTNVQIRDNNNYGWYEAGTSNVNIVTNAIVAGNGLGSLTQIGAASVFAHWNANGTYRPHDVGNVTV